jgi:hypothetical protein
MNRDFRVIWTSPNSAPPYLNNRTSNFHQLPIHHDSTHICHELPIQFYLRLPTTSNHQTYWFPTLLLENKEKEMVNRYQSLSLNDKTIAMIHHLTMLNSRFQDELHRMKTNER